MAWACNRQDLEATVMSLDSIIGIMGKHWEVLSREVERISGKQGRNKDTSLKATAGIYKSLWWLGSGWDQWKWERYMDSDFTLKVKQSICWLVRYTGRRREVSPG